MSYTPPTGPATTISKGIVKLAGDLSGTADLPTIKSDAVTEPKLAVANAPGTDQLLSWNGSAMQWVAAPTGSGGMVTLADLPAGSTVRVMSPTTNRPTTRTDITVIWVSYTVAPANAIPGDLWLELAA